MRFFNLIKSVIYQLKCERLCNKIEDDNKIKFEKEIIKLLKKFNLYNQDDSTLQKVTIVVEATELPIIKTECLIIGRKNIDKKK